MTIRKGAAMKLRFIRSTEILALEPDTDMPDHTKIVKVAAAFYQDPELPQGSGNLCFVCPFCHEIHYHGAGNALHPGSVKPAFGAYNGTRGKHCDPSKLKLNQVHSMSIFKWLSPGWSFRLTEVEEPDRAGSFPVRIRKHLTSRKGKNYQ